MNFRLIQMATSSHLWKRACSTVAALPSAVTETSITDPLAAAMAAMAKVDLHAMAKVAWMKNKKKRMFVKLLHIDENGVKERIDQFKRDYEWQKEKSRSIGKGGNIHVSVTKADLCSWARRLDKRGKSQHALEIFEWMEEKKMSFTSDQLAYYVGLIGKVKDYDAAQDYFDKVEPNFNQVDTKAKNWPAFKKLIRLKYESVEYSPYGFEFCVHRY